VCVCVCPSRPVSVRLSLVRYAMQKGTPSSLKNPSEDPWATDETSSRRKSTPGDASMRRSIQDLVLSIDPNIKIEPEVEDVRPPTLFFFPSARAHAFIFSPSFSTPSYSYFWILRTSSSTRSPISGAAWPSIAAAIRWK